MGTGLLLARLAASCALHNLTSNLSDNSKGIYLKIHFKKTDFGIKYKKKKISRELILLSTGDREVIMKKFAMVTGLTTLVTALASSQAQAVSFTEMGDAGESISTAQAVAAPGTVPLDSIAGSLASLNEADLFQIFLTGGRTFSATTRNAATDQAVIDAAIGIPITVALNPQLFLLDANGRGVYANDDNSGSSQATLLSGGLFSPQQSGIYYLGISGSGDNPVSTAGAIFPASDSSFPFNVGATGAGGQLPLSGFSSISGTVVNSGDYTGEYRIALTGSQFVQAAQPIPEPSSALGLLVLGGLGAASGLKKKKNKVQLVSNTTESK